MESALCTSVSTAVIIWFLCGKVANEWRVVFPHLQKCLSTYVALRTTPHSHISSLRP